MVQWSEKMFQTWLNIYARRAKVENRFDLSPHQLRRLKERRRKERLRPIAARRRKARLPLQREA